MSSTVLCMTTFKCDAADCEKELALGGDDTHTEAERAGWHLEIPVITRDLDFCPDCFNELKEFVGA